VLAPAQSLDPCEAKIPSVLRGMLPKAFPGYRLAHISDYSKANMDLLKKRNSEDPCVGVASADVDGDGFLDYAFFLTNKSRHTLLVTARNVSGTSWEISKLDDFGKDGCSGSYVEMLKPGQYRDWFDTDRAPSAYIPEPGRVRRYASRQNGFLAGNIESSIVAFFFNGKRWVHLWLSD